MKNPQRQVGLEDGNSQLICYVDDRPNIRVGNYVTLKDSDDPQRRWKITFVASHTIDKSDIKVKWNNNI